MEQSLFKYIWKYSSKQQLVIVCISLALLPVLYITLELPKRIINDAIDGKNFPVEIFGYEFSQIQYLLVLCFAFLFMVITNNGIKFALNLYKGQLGERMLRRLRYQLYFRILRFRMPQFRKMSAGEIIPIITAEVEALGGFFGDAIAVPVSQGGTLLVYFGFIALQSPLLGLAAVAFYPLQMWLIPKMQARVLRMTRLRVKNIRRLSDRVGESIAGVSEIHANDTSAWHMAEISARLYENYKIRFEIFLWKYFIKFTNNIINQLTPFFFYSFGGYLVIEGDIGMGSLVAVIAAYKDLAGPWKELLAYYQETADVQVKYQAVVENFDLTDLYDEDRFNQDPPAGTTIAGDFKLDRVSIGEPGSGQSLQDISFQIDAGSRVAVVGDDSSGRTELLQIGSGLLAADGGRMLLGDSNIDDLPESVLGRKLSYVSLQLHTFTGTLRTNLYYGLRHAPLTTDEPDPEWEKALKEAEITGNSLLNYDVSWDDYTGAGAESIEELDLKSVEYLNKIGFGPDLYRFGMQANLDPVTQSDMVDQILQARWAVAERVAADTTLQNAIVLWDPEQVNQSATLAENVLFALPADGSMDVEKLSAEPLVLSFLQETNLKTDLIEIGLKIAETMVDLFASVSSDNAMLSEFSFIRTEELPIYEQRIAQVKASGLESLSDEAKSDLIGVAFKLIPARHRLGLLSEEHHEKIIKARPVFKEMLERNGDNNFMTFARDAYIGAQSIGDNLIFGKVRLDRRDARAIIDKLIGDIVSERNLREPISLAGLDYDVGISGSRLSSAQRQKVGIVRAMIKQPAILFLDDVATSGAEGDRVILDFLASEFEKTTIVYGAPRLDLASGFDHIIYLKEGRVLADGPYDKVAAASGVE